MLTVGHVSASYLISKIPVGTKLSRREVFFIILCGYCLDLDIFLALLMGISPSWHHFLPTHTPLFVLIVFTCLFLILKKFALKAILMLGLVAALVHLILDDVGYWFQLWGLQAESKIPQIFWLYPFDYRRDMWWSEINHAQTGLDTLASYFIHAKVNVVFEILLFLIAGVLWMTSKKKANRNLRKG